MPAAERDVRRTVWFGRTRSYVASTQHAATNNASHHVPIDQTFSRATSGLNCPPPQQLTPNPAPREILAQNPREIYEPCSGIDYGRIMVLARHRQNKANFVHIQMQAVERSVFKCLQFLRGQSRELASLTPRDILFTEEGEIKIAGIENSRHVDPSRAHVMAPTFNALRSILNQIMQKNGSKYTWSQELQSFESALTKSTSARCLDNLVQPRPAMRPLTRKHAFFGPVTGEGGLTLLVELVNKTIFHEVTVRRAGTLVRTGPLGKPVTPSTT
ncbi:hypothetical protein AnigIFM50267_003318 [Aspergillus niger]|nr:hypothetical protein AnigIFM50267_003318 [Aspergillus niger]